eukprot:7456119-Alexandrium_andersonii.AAC.1
MNLDPVCGRRRGGGGSNEGSRICLAEHTWSNTACWHLVVAVDAACIEASMRSQQLIDASSGSFC